MKGDAPAPVALSSVGRTSVRDLVIATNDRFGGRTLVRELVTVRWKTASERVLYSSTRIGHHAMEDRVLKYALRAPTDAF